MRIYGEMKPEQKKKNSLVQEIMDFVVKNSESIQMSLRKAQTIKKSIIFSKKIRVLFTKLGNDSVFLTSLAHLCLIVQTHLSM